MQDNNLCFMSFGMSESTFSKAMPQKLVSDKFSKSHSTVLKKKCLHTDTGIQKSGLELQLPCWSDQIGHLENQLKKKKFKFNYYDDPCKYALKTK